MKLSKVQTTRFYKRLIIIFVSLVILTVVLIVYFSLSRTVVTVNLKPKEVTENLSVDIVKEAAAGKLAGQLITSKVSGSKTFSNTPTGETANTKEDVAVGQVTIFNNYTKAQPLAATTRLLTAAGILFRIKNRVDVPAGGKVENIDVYADQPGAMGNIGPSKFTIPGLWPGLQDKIYAESGASMTGGLRSANAITQEILNASGDTLKNELLEKARNELKLRPEVQNSGYQKNGLAISSLLLEKKSSANAGDETASYEISMSLQIMAVLLDESNLLNLASNNLTEGLPADEMVYENGAKNLTYTVEEYNLEKQTAKIKSTLIEQVIPKISSPIFNRANLTSKNISEVKTYFSNFKEIASVEVKFSPFWVTRTPSLKDHIQIKVK